MHNAELATHQHWLSCFSRLKIYNLWNTVQLLWESSWHNMQKANASSSMEVRVLPCVAVMKPHKSTGLTILNWTKYKPLHTTTCVPFLPQLSPVHLTYNSGSYVCVYIYICKMFQFSFTIYIPRADEIYWSDTDISYLKPSC